MPNGHLFQVGNTIGAVTANAYFLAIISVFVFRITGHSDIGRWVGLASFLTVVPLAYLLVISLKTDRPLAYDLWLGLMMLFLLAELIVDGILKLDFRNVRWATIVYVIFFFGATGGMIGVAGQAGKWWTVITTLVFVVMAALAFMQRSKTGV
jgi:uncharacterized membrane protein